MLDLLQIESHYPESLRPFKKNLLREYLQFKILEIIFDSAAGEHLCFMGGTALKIIHGNSRFSEDLDFDNRGLDASQFDGLVSTIQKKLKLQGCFSETKSIVKGAYTAHIKIPDILFSNHISNHRDEKLLIKIVAEPQNFAYKPDQTILNKFDVFTRINVIPPDILLAQKLLAVFLRNRAMGRDFYDIIFLLGKTRPRLDYLTQKLNIQSFSELKQRLLTKCDKLDFKQLATDVEPFLFSSIDRKKVLLFPVFINQFDFE